MTGHMDPSGSPGPIDPGPDLSVVAAFQQAHTLRPRPDPMMGVRSSTRESLVAPDNHQIVPLTDIGPSRAFATVVHQRRSRRRFTPPHLDQVGVVLARAGLEHHHTTDHHGHDVTFRRAPSAGARHPLTLVLLAGEIEGLGPNTSWVLDGRRAVLRPGRFDTADTVDALDTLTDAVRCPSRVPAAIIAVADPPRILDRYPDGISLLWRETGALLMLLHLAATDLNLASCIAGTSGILCRDTGTGTDPVDVGALVLGSP